MSKNEESLKFITNNMRLEGMHITNNEKNIISDCLSGKRTVEDTVREIIYTYLAIGTK